MCICANPLKKKTNCTWFFFIFIQLDRQQIKDRLKFSQMGVGEQQEKKDEDGISLVLIFWRNPGFYKYIIKRM